MQANNNKSSNRGEGGGGTGSGGGSRGRGGGGRGGRGGGNAANQQQAQAPSSAGKEAESSEVTPTGPLRFVTRARDGVHLYSCSSTTTPYPITPLEVTKTGFACGPATSMRFANEDGSLFAVALPDRVDVFRTESGELLQSLAQGDVAQIAFSPSNSLLLTWERWFKDKHGADPTNCGNLALWDLSTGEELHRCVHKSVSQQTWPPIRWTSDERLSAKVVSKELQFFSGRNWKNVVQAIKIPDIANFSFAPGPAPPLVACFVPEKKGLPGFVRLYKYPKTTGEPVGSRTLMKATSVDLLWNSKGTALLMATHTEVDRTGKSYYGETGLFFLSSDGRIDCIVDLDADGPIHQCSWSPDGEHFVVIYGYMPAKATLFNAKCEKLADFGRAPRNTISWSPCSRLVCLAGFGNLNGQMDFWDVKKVKKVGEAKASCASALEWSPDSQYILTAVLSPKIRVDNGFSIFTYNGIQVHEQAVGELYQVAWQSAPQGTFPLRRIRVAKPTSAAPASSSGEGSNGAASSAASGAPKAKPALYQPPSRRGLGEAAAVIHREEEREAGPRKYTAGGAVKKQEQPVGYVPDTKTAKRNRRRRQRKNKGDGEGEDDEEGEQEEGNSKELGPLTAEELNKRIKAANKKLRQIEQLKEKGTQGLNAAQLQKLESEQALRQEVASLQKELASL
ncbi:Eukaryotic translation initiation factor 2A [Balamuthia mandrillaris]